LTKFQVSDSRPSHKEVWGGGRGKEREREIEREGERERGKGMVPAFKHLIFESWA
jgi:hypothetical protein